MLHNIGNILPIRERAMKIKEVIQSDLVDFSNIPPSYYLLGLLSAFENRFQAMADKDMKEISWKQFFAIICINMCNEPPTLRELSEVLGSSHQNVKQILLKLRKKDFIKFVPDENDKRKQRIVLTDKPRILDLHVVCARRERNGNDDLGGFLAADIHLEQFPAGSVRDGQHVGLGGTVSRRESELRLNDSVSIQGKDKAVNIPLLPY